MSFHEREAPPRPRREGFWPNLLARVATALVVLPAILATLFFGSPAMGVALVAAAMVLGLREFFGLVEARGIAPMRTLGFLLMAVVFLEEAYPGWASGPVWPLVSLLLLGSALVRPGDVAQAWPAAAWTLLGATYLGALGGTMAGLRLLPPVEQGAWRLVLLLAIIMASDILAFFVGHAIGRRRLAPGISPGKTIEGALGGIAGGILGAAAIRWLGLPALSWKAVLVLGVLVSAMGIAGDLVESLLKRWAGAKDSGGLFPGHGGMLDRIDSLLFGAPVLYYYFVLVARQP